MDMFPNIKFDNSNRDFTSTLNKRVNDYFNNNRFSRHANAEMVIKTVVMFSLYFGPFFLLLSGAITGVFLSILMVIIMGVGLAGIGLSVMHDGIHGAYSGKPWVNKIIGYSLNLIGASSFNWKVQHNVIHHTYTNIHEADEDISHKTALRINPHDDWKWFHKYQFIYAWFLYGLMSLGWIIYADFPQLLRYQKDGWIKQQKTNPLKEWIILIFTKLGYLAYTFVLPLFLTSWYWWQILIGIFIMHYVTGFLLAIVFQPAHVSEHTEFPQPDENHSLNDNWAIHQLKTTTNFANNSRWFTWYVGALNFQIEHHLFPGVCHVHYRKIAKIVQATAAEYNLPYKSVRTFADALNGHQKLLIELGKR